MAYIDTGLGWYLDENYLLTLGSETLGTVASSGGWSRLLPYRPSSSDVSYTDPIAFQNGSYMVHAAASGAGHVLVYVTPNTTQNFNRIYYISDLSGYTYYQQEYDGTALVFGSYWSRALTNYDPTSGLYYYRSGIYTSNSLVEGGVAKPAADEAAVFADALAYYQSGDSTIHTATKVQGGAGAFAFVSYPHDGNTVHVAVGISSIGNPNSAATVAVDGVNGSYNTFNREGMQFTMFYTEQLTGTLTANVPVVALDTDISGLPGVYEPRLFLAVADAAQIHVGNIDPYSGAGESEPGAEEATFDFDSTGIDFGTPPTITAAGMVELYIPSTSDLASLAQYLWAGSFDPDNFKKLFADPMDAIIGLQIVPVTATEIGTTPDTLYVGNISTGLSMPKASRQYVPVDCGSLSIPRRLGSYLDYSPHTEMQLYLPYIGFVDISPDDCMGGTVSVKYMVDIIGGTCVAQVKCNSHVLYEYAGACSCQVPVSAGQYQNIVLGAVRGAIGLTSGVLGAAGGGLFSGLSEAADAAMSMTKPKIQRSGGFGGSSGLMGHQTPYIIYTVPRLIVPGRQNNFIGYPSYITRTLGDLTGYTQIDSIHLSGIPASQSEQAEIEQLLQEGVYL